MTSWQLTNALVAFLLPPGLLILFLAGGLLLRRARPRTARALFVSGLGGLYLLSMPLLANWLIALWESPPERVIARDAQAIVVLGGGRYLQAPEYGGDTVSAETLVRLRYAAHLQRATGLPLLVSGGRPDGGESSEARAMKHVLEKDFAVAVRWQEGDSDNTLQNARYSHRLLRPQGIANVILVTHAWHMPRARFAFEQSGFSIIPAPTGHVTHGPLTVLDFLPDARALRKSAWVVHEMIGLFWYRLRLLFQAEARE